MHHNCILLDSDKCDNLKLGAILNDVESFLYAIDDIDLRLYGIEDLVILLHMIAGIILKFGGSVYVDDSFNL